MEQAQETKKIQAQRDRALRALLESAALAAKQSCDRRHRPYTPQLRSVLRWLELHP